MIKFTKVNSLITIQDAGRKGFQSSGVPISGAMDLDAMMIANLLVGNKKEAACFELGPGSTEIQVENALISFTGKGHQAQIGDQVLKFNSPIFINEKAKIKLKASKGMWTYLAIAGGINVPYTLNSKSTYLQAGFGGKNGVLLKSTDHFSINELNDVSKKIISGIANNKPTVNWFVDLNVEKNNVIRIFSGPEWKWIPESQQQKLLNNSIMISNEVNRMGYRLESELIKRKVKDELISSGVTKGTIQLTNEGKLIALMADSQTIGGYPRLAQISAVDLGKFSQLQVGTEFQFQLISYEEAEALYVKRQHDFIKIKEAIRIKYI